MLVLSSPLLKLIRYILADDPRDGSDIGPKYLDESQLNSTSQALACAKREALGMADVVQEVLYDLREVLKSDSNEKLQAISERDDVVDRL